VEAINIEDYPYLKTMNRVEESLVNTFEILLNREIPSKDIILREVDCWQGRADLVHVNIKGLNPVFPSKLALLANLTYAQILSLLHYKSGRTFTFIKNKIGLADSTIKKALKELIKEGIILRNPSGSYILHENFTIPTVVFNAYEAKLHNWKRALYQAIQYYGFAQYSWVVMPEKYIRPAILNIGMFEANGIGLIGVCETGNYTTYLKAKKNQPSRKAFHLVGIGKAFL
jgi:DNA-binding Lrp family transcriptional regulator